MKINVELDNETVDRLSSYAEHNNRSIDEVVSEMLESYLTRPASELELIMNNTEMRGEYQSFQKVLNNYMVEEIETLRSMARTGSGLDTDFPMAKVLERLTSKHLFKSYLNVDLFTTYMKNKI